MLLFTKQTTPFPYLHISHLKNATVWNLAAWNSPIVELISMVLFICVLRTVPLPICNSFIFSTQLFSLVFHYSLIFESLGQYHPFSRSIFGMQIMIFFWLQSKGNYFEHHCASSERRHGKELHHHLMAGILSLTQTAGMRVLTWRIIVGITE